VLVTTGINGRSEFQVLNPEWRREPPLPQFTTHDSYSRAAQTDFERADIKGAALPRPRY
jgi:hypothetical protein